MGTQGVPFNSGPMTVTGGTLPYTFSIVGTLPAGLTLNPANGAVSGTPTASGTFTIQVKDANGSVGTGCAITINPPLSATCSAVTMGTQGVPFNSGPMTVTGGTLPYTFSIVGTLPAGLTLNPANGAVSGTPTASGTFTIQVKDANGSVGTGCAITINPPLSVTCSTTNVGDVGVPFSSSAVTVSGGTMPYTFSIVGTLPAGLTLNTSTGAVSGTPTASGSFTIQVKDAKGAVGTGCAITINPAISVTCSATNSGQVGVTFSSSAITVTGGTMPYTFSVVGTLPAGLTLNTSTGAVSGKPTAAGSFSIKVTDAKGGVAATTCPFTIVAIPPPVISCAKGTASVGVSYSSNFPVTGGSGSFTFLVSAGSLPAGLSLNTTTWRAHGYANGGRMFGFTVKVVDNVTGAVAYSNCTSACSGGGSTVTLTWTRFSETSGIHMHTR